jgi:long-chain acyl-CoA synthetase
MYIINALNRAARVAPDRIASVHEGRRKTWSQVREGVARLAGALCRHGVMQGDRVAVLGWNSDRFLETALAVTWAGAVIVPLNTRLAPAELMQLMRHSGVVALLYDDEFAPVMHQASAELSSLRLLVSLGDGDSQSGAHSYDAFARGATPVDGAICRPGDLLGIFYTGGTTGLPKGVMLSHANLAHQTSLHVVDLGWSPETSYLHVLPMFHLGGFANLHALTSLAGTHHYTPRFELEACLGILSERRITAAALGPVIIGWLLDYRNLSSFDLSALRHLAYGTAAISEPTLRRAVELLPRVEFTQVYGLSEISGTMSVLRPKDHGLGGSNTRLSSAGQASWGVDARIFDPEGRELPRGELGEIVARSPGVMMGYLDDPEQTAKALNGGWLHSGDLGYMDDQGYIFIGDRAKDMIVTGGENVFSAEVEGAIASYPGVAQVAVIAIPSEQWGESVHAVVVPSAGAKLDPAAIIAHCRERIAGFKCPRSVELRAENLPLSGVNKVQKNVLREPYWRGRARRVN